MDESTTFLSIRKKAGDDACPLSGDHCRFVTTHWGKLFWHPENCYAMHKAFYKDVFYMAGYYEDRTVNNKILSGRYENSPHYMGLSIGNNFSAIG